MFGTYKITMPIIEFLSKYEKGEIRFADAPFGKEGRADPRWREWVIETALKGVSLPKAYVFSPRWSNEVETPYRDLVAGDWPYRDFVIGDSSHLRAVVDFHDGKFALSEDANLWPCDDMRLGACTYEDLMGKHPRAAGRFLAHELDFVCIITDEPENVEFVKEIADSFT